MIDQRQCKYVKTIAKLHSISRAAEVLYVSQPFLSRFIKKIEEELGVKLFDRNQMPLSLTEAGKKFLEYVSQFEALEAKMQQDFAEMSTGVFQRLKVSTILLLGAYILPRIIPGFAEQYPSVDLQISECRSTQLQSFVETGQADLALSNLLPDNPALDHFLICDDSIFLVALYDDDMKVRYPEQRLNPACPVPANWDLLKEKNLIVLPEGMNMRNAADTICRHFDFHPKNIVETAGIPSALSLVSCGRGITFVCQSAISCLRPQASLIYFSLGEMAGLTSISAIFKKDISNPFVREFCRCARMQMGENLRQEIEGEEE